MSKEHLHQDPIRFPSLQAPIENRLIKMHENKMKEMMVDITRELVKLKSK